MRGRGAALTYAFQDRVSVMDGGTQGIALLENIQAELAGCRAGHHAMVLPRDGLNQPDTDLMEILEVYQ